MYLERGTRVRVNGYVDGKIFDNEVGTIFAVDAGANPRGLCYRVRFDSDDAPGIIATDGFKHWWCTKESTKPLTSQIR